MAGVYEGVDRYGRDIWEGQVQDSNGNWVPAVRTGISKLIDQSRPAEGIEWQLDDFLPSTASPFINRPTMEESAGTRSTPPEYWPGSRVPGQTFDNMPEPSLLSPDPIVGGDVSGWVQGPNGQWYRSDPTTAPAWGLGDPGFGQPSARGTEGYQAMDMSLGGVTPLPVESANNPNNVGGDPRRLQEEDRRWAEENRRSIEEGYGEIPRTSSSWGGGQVLPMDAGGPTPDWGLGDTGFRAPATTGPAYQYGTGMGFGLPDLIDPRRLQEEDRRWAEENRRSVEAGLGEIPRAPTPDWGVGDPGFRRQQEEDRRWAEENRRSVEEGYGEIPRAPTPDWSLGDPGFREPATAGPTYQYGTGMGFGLPDISQPTPYAPVEDANNPNTVGGASTPDWGVGDPGFPAPSVESANNPNNVGGYYGANGWIPPTPFTDPDYAALPTATEPSYAPVPSFGDFGMGSMTGMNQDYAAGVSPTPGYSIQPGTAAATYGGGLTQQDADTQFAEYQALQARLANEAAFYSAQQAALPSSPQNYFSQIVQPYDRNFGGQIAGYNPFSTQYQAY